MLDYVTATVNKDLNIGTYNEILYLTDEEGITEPFYLNLTVEGEQPEWADHIDSEFLANSMNISGQVYLYGDLDSDARDIVGVFDDQNQCHGFANITHDTQSGETGLYLTVYDSQASGRALNFRLQEGWNWVSFNLKSDQLSDVNTLLGGMKWSDGDILTDLGSNLTLTYEAAQKQWIATDSTDTVTISPKNAYAIKVKKDCTLPVGGTVIKDQDDRTITVSKGWNAIGYTLMTNLSVETALSDYFDNAEPGDVIKSHTEFAYFTKTGNTGRWRGSLQFMKPGEGYMMLRKAESDASTGEVMTYKANAVIGSPDQPTAINFMKAEYADGQWYSINGMMLQKRPTKSGVYIFNGRKVVVK